MSIFLIIFVLLFLIINSYIKMHIQFNREGENDFFIIKFVALYSILQYEKKVVYIDVVEGRDQMLAWKLNMKTSRNNKKLAEDNLIVNIKEMKKVYDKFKDIYCKYEVLLKHINRNLNLVSISWQSEIGMGDAAQTALITGVVNALKNLLIIILTNREDPSLICVSVTPNYQNKFFKTSIDGIFSIKVGHIINAGIKTILNKLRMV